ncbi:hypothetical protein, partial [Thalassolituus marinus]|uniref:hypothetical protein n=1 Tax=Thalassolituus marinus TaxID=671053 RepID=UPI001CE2FD28
EFSSLGHEHSLQAHYASFRCVRENGVEPNINFRGTYTFAPTGELPKLEDLMAPIEGYRPRNES